MSDPMGETEEINEVMRALADVLHIGFPATPFHIKRQALEELAERLEVAEITGVFDEDDEDFAESD